MIDWIEIILSLATMALLVIYLAIEIPRSIRDPRYGKITRIDEMQNNPEFRRNNVILLNAKRK